MDKAEITSIEVDLLLDALDKRYGYDFRSYSRKSIERSIECYLQRSPYDEVSELIPLIIHDRSIFDELLRQFSVTVSTMFRDPKVFQRIKTEVFPWLRTHPHFRIWHAGCATGEEVYSMAILLHEAGLYERATIFATDFNEAALRKAALGVYNSRDGKATPVNTEKRAAKVRFRTIITRALDILR